MHENKLKKAVLLFFSFNLGNRSWIPFLTCTWRNCSSSGWMIVFCFIWIDDWWIFWYINCTLWCRLCANVLWKYYNILSYDTFICFSMYQVWLKLSGYWSNFVPCEQAYEKKTTPKWRYDLGRRKNFEQVSVALY